MPSPYFNQDTIAAIITAPNALSGLGVIRVSGAEARNYVRPLLKGSLPAELECHRLYRAELVSSKGFPLDDGMFVFMKNPRSFTGEDVVELHLHGNPLILRKVMQELQSAGAREALPGEFSFRAFRNGKLTLDQAESVADLISSQSEEGTKRALNHLLGRPRGEIQSLKSQLVDRLAEVEIDIDFSDQGLSGFDRSNFVEKLDLWCSRVHQVRCDFERSQPLREGIRVALLGEPNSGKSSLFNRLLGEDRSIVSKEAGTTRDVVRESVQIGGLLFRFSDTAGLRQTGNEIEAAGIERSFGEASAAHLVFWIFDGTAFSGSAETLSSQEAAMRARLGNKTKVIALWNKADIAAHPSESWISFFRGRGTSALSISARSGRGLDELIAEITRLFSQTPDSLPDFWISRRRHYEVLGRALESVAGAAGKLRRGEVYPDLLAADLRAALHQLGELTGEVTSDDILNHIFSEFCIGK